MSSLRQRMIHDMQLHGYGERTREAYVCAVRQLREFYQLSPAKISEDQIRDYFLHRRNRDNWSANTRPPHHSLPLSGAPPLCPLHRAANLTPSP